MAVPKPIPPSVRAWLKETRLYTDATIDGLAYFDIGDLPWIGFPVRDATGNLLFHKLKAGPGNTSQNKGLVEPRGSEAALFGAEYLSTHDISKPIVVCEGEPDCMLLRQSGIQAVTGTAGAGTFHGEWLAHFPKGVNVILCFDNDEAGQKGREKVQAMIVEKRKDITLSNVTFPVNKPKGYDVTDFWREFTAEGRDPVPAFLSMATPVEAVTGTSKPKKDNVHRDEGPGEEAARGKFAPLTAPETVLTLPEWRGKIREHFPPLASTAEICASVVAQLLIHGVYNPFALILIDRAGAGKTITLNFFRHIDDLTYFTSDFTPACFVTSIAGRTESQLQKIDLLPKIRWRTLLVKDLAPLLSDNDDTLRKHLGMLTDILDGEGFKKESGVHGQRGYEGDYLFMFLAASTPFPPRVWKLMTGMGHRFFFLGLESKRKRKDELKMQIQGVNYKIKEKACRDLTHDFIRSVWAKWPGGVTWDGDNDEHAAIDRIVDIADFLALFRGDIYVHEERWTDGQVLTHTEPKIEDASRINQCMYNLARGHAVLSGRNYITMEDMDILSRVALDTAPAPRPRIFRELVKKDGKITVGELSEALEVSVKTAKKEMHKLAALGVVDSDLLRQEETNEFGMAVDESGQKRTTMTLKPEFRWWIDVLAPQKAMAGIGVGSNDIYTPETIKEDMALFEA